MQMRDVPLGKCVSCTVSRILNINQMSLNRHVRKFWTCRRAGYGATRNGNKSVRQNESITLHYLIRLPYPISIAALHNGLHEPVRACILCTGDSPLSMERSGIFIDNIARVLSYAIRWMRRVEWLAQQKLPL